MTGRFIDTKMKLLFDVQGYIILSMSRYQTRLQTNRSKCADQTMPRYRTRFQERVAENPDGYEKWKWFQQTFIKQSNRFVKGVISIRTYLQKMWTIWSSTPQNQQEFHSIINSELTQFQQKYSYYVKMLNSAKEFFTSNVSNNGMIKQARQQMDEAIRVLNKFKKAFGIKYDEV